MLSSTNLRHYRSAPQLHTLTPLRSYPPLPRSATLQFDTSTSQSTENGPEAPSSSYNTAQDDRSSTAPTKYRVRRRYRGIRVNRLRDLEETESYLFRPQPVSNRAQTIRDYAHERQGGPVATKKPSIVFSNNEGPERNQDITVNLGERVVVARHLSTTFIIDHSDDEGLERTAIQSEQRVVVARHISTTFVIDDGHDEGSEDDGYPASSSTAPLTTGFPSVVSEVLYESHITQANLVTQSSKQKKLLMLEKEARASVPWKGSKKTEIKRFLKKSFSKICGSE